jgi:hypothetical protein
MTFLEAKKQLCSGKLNTSYANIIAAKNQLFSQQNLDDAINAGIQRAWDYKIWPFSEATDTETGSSASNPFSISMTGKGFLGESAFLAIVNGVPWVGQGAGKRNFRDFMNWFANYPSDKSKIWAEFGGSLYYNANAITVPYTIVVYGKSYAPVYVTDADDDVLMPFSVESDAGEDTDSSGNAAIILFAYAYLLSSEKKKNAAQAMQEEKRAYAILDAVWAPIAEGKAQNNPQNQPFFNTQDYFQNNRSTRYNTNIGNFP